MNYQKGSAAVWITVLLIVVLIVVGGVYWYKTKNAAQPTIVTSMGTSTQQTKQLTQVNTQPTPGRAPSRSKIDPELSASPTSGAAPLGVSFSANKQGLGDNDSYSVDFGDGTQSSTSKFICGLQYCSQQHSYAAAGTYTAKYTDASGSTAKTFTITVTPAPTTNKTVNNLALNISFAVPSNWIIQNLNTEAEDPASLGKISDGYGFGVSVSTSAKDNTATVVYPTPDFATLQSQASGYAVDNARTGCFDNTYTKINNLNVSGLPAVLFRAGGGCNFHYQYETLWIHGQTQDWYVTFEDTSYLDKYPSEAAIMQEILSSIHVMQ